MEQTQHMAEVFIYPRRSTAAGWLPKALNVLWKHGSKQCRRRSHRLPCSGQHLQKGQLRQRRMLLAVTLAKNPWATPRGS